VTSSENHLFCKYYKIPWDLYNSKSSQVTKPGTSFTCFTLLNFLRDALGPERACRLKTHLQRGTLS